MRLHSFIARGAVYIGATDSVCRFFRFHLNFSCIFVANTCVYSLILSVKLRIFKWNALFVWWFVRLYRNESKCNGIIALPQSATTLRPLSPLFVFILHLFLIHIQIYNNPVFEQHKHIHSMEFVYFSWIFSIQVRCWWIIQQQKNADENELISSNQWELTFNDMYIVIRI